MKVSSLLKGKAKGKTATEMGHMPLKLVGYFRGIPFYSSTAITPGEIWFLDSKRIYKKKVKINDNT